MFLKSPSGLAAHGATISASHEGGLLVPEVELAAIIGRRCVVTGPEEALAVVAGYTIMNDLTDASHFRGDSIDLVMAKNFPGCAPLGPWMVTPDEIGDVQDLELACAVNGEPRQADSTASMIWRTAELIAYSSGAGLAPGDVVSTGSPAGVFKAGASVPALSQGDTVEARIAGIGCLTNVVGRAGGFID
jgi:2-keto-4-pentenoate hydratase/2-oxohepta-3-ene-1,7-dioic acid hydratase in catechol pathway